ncbi:MAG: hypothetical protein ACYTAN_02545 [Planctomycetota bacterium]|jgi:DNA-binding response OmpR family regulator
MSDRILLISQDRWLVDRIRVALESAGFETEIALSGAVGVNVAAERRLDLLLADEAVEDFHNICKIKDPAAATYRLPAVVIAANCEPSKEQVGRLVPFAVLPREFDEKQLVGRIKRAIQVTRKLKRRVVA